MTSNILKIGNLRSYSYLCFYTTDYNEKYVNSCNTDNKCLDLLQQFTSNLKKNPEGTELTHK